MSTPSFGPALTKDGTRFRLWAPTAQQVSLCIYAKGSGPAQQVATMRWDAKTGNWSHSLPADFSGKYYTYLVDVFVPGTGVIRNRVTDPYSISLTTDSTRSYIANLNSGHLKPRGWDLSRSPVRVKASTDF